MSVGPMGGNKRPEGKEKVGGWNGQQELHDLCFDERGTFRHTQTPHWGKLPRKQRKKGADKIGSA